MSNIYIQEPATSGKVLLKTTVGDIDIELWAKECPKACRNFIQLCMEGYYNGTIFHRVVKDFIVQGGDPDGDGTGGESIYGLPFKDEFHSRLRYTRRGLVGMANSGKDDNGSQFFFTMAATPELQNQNTLFGKVTGDTLYNMLKLEDGLVDHNERPMYPQKIIRADILSNPFDDLVPRKIKKDKEEKKEKSKSREKGVKNFGLLSFGEEAEEDEEETNRYVQSNQGKAKSLHDVVDDPKLSKDVVKIEKLSVSDDDEHLPNDVSIEEEAPALSESSPHNIETRKQLVISKLKAKSVKTSPEKNEPLIKKENSDGEDDYLLTHDEEKRRENEKKKDEIRKEILSLKREYQTEKKQQETVAEKKVKKHDQVNIKNTQNNEIIESFINERKKYSSIKTKMPLKGAGREDFTLSLLSKFRSKLNALKEQQTDNDADVNDNLIDDQAVEDEINSDSWLTHTLRFDDPAPVLAKDASTKGDDWYDAYDPRNPLNKRKRGEHAKVNTHRRENKRSK